MDIIVHMTGVKQWTRVTSVERVASCFCIVSLRKSGFYVRPIKHDLSLGLGKVAKPILNGHVVAYCLFYIGLDGS